MGNPSERIPVWTKKGFSMYTLSLHDVNNLLNMAFETLTTCLDHPGYACWNVTSMSPKQARRMVVSTRRRVKRRLARAAHAGKGSYPRRLYASHSWICQSLVFIVDSATCRFAVWQRRQDGWETQPREEIELHLAAMLCREIKRLGFQLDQ